MNRRTKIVCTLGPAVGSAEKIQALHEAGMNVARLNFSHGDHEDHAQNYKWVRQASKESGRGIGILADLQGPKIRLGKFKDGSTVWENGETIRITVDDVEGIHDRVSTTYKHLANDARPGDRLLVDDGKLSLVVKEIDDNDVVCEVVEGGPVSDHKGLSLPGMDVSVPALSDKDIDDLRFALGLGVDFIALSFVRHADDIRLVHQVMEEEGRFLPVIAKLEKPEAVENMEAIVDSFDGIMVARGDLGVETPLEQVPLVQKKAIALARSNAKPVIVATQMLDSMIENSRPTRAEASDVANAVMDGADAVMLSGETSVGKYPFITVRTMAKIAQTAESAGENLRDSVTEKGVVPLNHLPQTKSGVISYSATGIAERLNAKAIAAFTTTGDTARRVARLHSTVPLIGFTPDKSVRNQLTLSWGTEPYKASKVDSTDGIFELVNDALLEKPEYAEGDRIVIVAGTPPGIAGTTNMIYVHKLGDKS